MTEAEGPGEITKAILIILPAMINKRPFNLQWANIVLTLCKNVGDTEDVRQRYKETEWRRYEKEFSLLTIETQKLLDTSIAA